MIFFYDSVNELKNTGTDQDIGAFADLVSLYNLRWIGENQFENSSEVKVEMSQSKYERRFDENSQLQYSLPKNDYVCECTMDAIAPQRWMGISASKRRAIPDEDMEKKKQPIENKSGITQWKPLCQREMSKKSRKLLY